MLYTNQEIAKRRNKAIKVKKIVTIIIYIIVIPILIYNISLIIQSLCNPSKTPSFLGIKTYVIISGSMKPKINIGDIVITKDIKNEKEEIKVGDIIAFRKGQSVITHRIVNIEPDENNILRITTKGDNNNSEDSESVTFESIEGKVIGRIPKVGKIALFMSNKTIIILIIVLFYFYYTNQMNNKKKKESRRMKRIEYEEKKKGE